MQIEMCMADKISVIEMVGCPLPARLQGSLTNSYMTSPAS